MDIIWNFVKSKKVYVIITFFILCISLLLFRLTSSANLPPSELQYPVIEVKLDSRWKAHKKIQVAGAKNEYVFVHFRIVNVDLASFRVKITEKRQRNKISKVNFYFYQICWAPADSVGKLPADALLPLDQGLVQTGKPLEILVAFRIPPDLPKGYYNYDLLFIDKKQSCREPFTLRVFDFNLPDDLPITIFGGFWKYKPDFYSRYGVKSFTNYLQTIKNYYRKMRQYKFNALGGSYFFSFKELTQGKKIEEFNDYHQLVSYALNDLKFRFFMIPKLRGWRTIGQPGNNFLARANQFYPTFQDYLRRQGWQNRGLNYLIDEPKSEQYPAVFQAFAAAKALAPTIKTLCAGWNPDPQFVKVIDIWATPAGHYQESRIAANRSQGQEQWLYANRLHGFNHPYVHQRLIGWLLFRYRFDGYLLWGVNFWPQDPWTTPPGASNYLRRGTFFYPHPRTGQPVPTLRLESLRRGLQDYQYLVLLAEAHQKGMISSDTFAEIDQRVQSLTRDLRTNDFVVPMQDLENIRLQIGELLERPQPGNKTGGKSVKSPVLPKLTVPGRRRQQRFNRRIYRGKS